MHNWHVGLALERYHGLLLLLQVSSRSNPLRTAPEPMALHHRGPIAQVPPTPPLENAIPDNSDN